MAIGKEKRLLVIQRITQGIAHLTNNPHWLLLSNATSIRFKFLTILLAITLRVHNHVCRKNMHTPQSNIQLINSIDSFLLALLWIHKAVLNSSILRIKEILNLHTEQQVYRGDVLHYNILKTSEYSLITKKYTFSLIMICIVHKTLQGTCIVTPFFLRIFSNGIQGKILYALRSLWQICFEDSCCR